MKFQTHPQRQWRIIQNLGSQGGGFNGGIIKVQDRASGKIYIEKRAKPSDISHGLIHREVAALKQVGSYDYITDIVDHHISPHRASIYLEYCNMGSLTDFIDRKADPRSTGVNGHLIWQWFIEIAGALTYCHSGPTPEDPASVHAWNTIIHRDVKPANILLTRVEHGPQAGDVVAMLADFGCSISKDFVQNMEIPADSQSMLTEQFAPPEAPRYTGRSDVWQLGACMVCLCWRTQMWRRADMRFPAGRQASAELHDVVRWSMERDFEKRPGAPELLARVRSAYDVVKSRAGGVGGQNVRGRRPAPLPAPPRRYGGSREFDDYDYGFENDYGGVCVRALKKSPNWTLASEGLDDMPFPRLQYPLDEVSANEQRKSSCTTDTQI
ncbi:kinase-like domain-containing protein [Massariosphaeria phaeospora]|uniref:non-specific serine/threonine protein kinase n=1 Tax=Massariosphaeria phaeospora TaxID=100035 RepID=A0A7C8IFA9_9PLEO|nr:kinase-like domain-containing protein [Massariosphaeria phaeospora]